MRAHLVRASETVVQNPSLTAITLSSAKVTIMLGSIIYVIIMRDG